MKKVNLKGLLQGNTKILQKADLRNILGGSGSTPGTDIIGDGATISGCGNTCNALSNTCSGVCSACRSEGSPTVDVPDGPDFASGICIDL